MPSQLQTNNLQVDEQCLIIVHSDGASNLLKGDSRDHGDESDRDILPAFLSKGWVIQQMVPFGFQDGAVLVLLKKERVI